MIEIWISGSSGFNSVPFQVFLKLNYDICGSNQAIIIFNALCTSAHHNKMNLLLPDKFAAMSVLPTVDFVLLIRVSYQFGI